MNRDYSRIITKYAVILASGWTLLVVVIMLLIVKEEMQDVRELIRNEARIHFLKDQAFRLWGASHGGVYVPPTDHTPPNPNLSHIPNRDIVTTEGKKLTLMNPAYMVRQLTEDYEEQYGIKGHITSRKPLRPENAPDEWERAALESFDSGNTEASEFSDIDGKPYLRLMRPLIVKKTCLKCHGYQEYKEGDVRGGFGVSVPAAAYYAASREELVEHAVTLGLLWLIGLAALVFGTRRLQQKVRERDRAVEVSKKLLHDMGERVKELRCMYDVTESIWTRSTLEEIFQDVIELIPSGWHYPEITKSKVIFDGKEYVSESFKESKWRQSGHIIVNGVPRGTIDVYYLEERPELDEGPFLTEERNLINGIAKNISEAIERNQAREALRGSEERFRGLAKMLPEAVFETDRDLIITFANQRAFELFGYSAEDMEEGLNGLEMFTPNDRERARENFGKRQLREDPGTIEYEAIRKDGSTFPVLFHANSILKEGVLVGIRGIVVDITETKRLQDLESRAERLALAGTIAGQVAHDFNNLLAPLMAYPDFIRDKLPENHPSIIYVDQIEKAAQKFAEINQDLLTMGRRGHYNQKILNLNEVVQNALMELEPYFKTLVCKIDLSDDLMDILGGSAQLYRVISNLLYNAKDAMQDSGQITVKTENCYVDDISVDYGRVPQGEYVKLTISDTGCGIPDDIVQKIFDPFFSSKATDKKRGSGLGLSVVDAVIKDHNGYIDLSTKAGEGTSFYIYFPVTRESIDSQNADETCGGSESILVIDDDDIQREVSTQLLSKLGYKVSSVASGEKAINFLRENPQDLIMLDMIMPGGIDGAETFHQIRKIDPDQKVIISSGFSESDRVLEVQKLGAGTFLKKPITRQTIADAVRTELDREAKVMI